MTMTHTLTTSVNVTDDAKNVIAEMDVTITFRVIAGYPETSATPAEPDELEIETVVCAGTVYDAPYWSWDATTTTAIQSEMREVVAADREDAAEFLADCRRDKAMMRDWDDR